jgi:hypothetical protein
MTPVQLFTRRTAPVQVVTSSLHYFVVAQMLRLASDVCVE